MKKPIICILIAALLLCSLVGCGGTGTRPAAETTRPRPADGTDFGDGAYTLTIPVTALVRSDIYGLTATYTDFVLDAQGRVTEKKDGGTRLSYTYDGAGRVLTATATYDDGSVSTNTYTYNEHGMCESDTEAGVSGDRQFTYTYEYDAAGRPVKRITHNAASPEFVTVNEFRYEEGRLVRARESNYHDGLSASASSVYESTFEYDAAGNVVAMHSRNDRDETATHRFTFGQIGSYSRAPGAGETLRPMKDWKGFSCEPRIPMPDSVDGEAVFHGDELRDDTHIYIYRLPTADTPIRDGGYPLNAILLPNDAAAKRVSDAYRQVLTEVLGYELRTDDADMFFVCDAGKAIALLKTGVDDAVGWYLMVGFPARGDG